MRLDKKKFYYIYNEEKAQICLHQLLPNVSNNSLFLKYGKTGKINIMGRFNSLQT